MADKVQKSNRAPESVRVLWILVVIPLTGVLLWHIVSVARIGSVGKVSLLSIVMGFVFLFLSRGRSRNLLVAAILSVGIPVLFWLGVLDLLLNYTRIFAMTLFSIIAAALLHATFIFISLAASESVAFRRIREVGFTLAILVIFFTAAEGLVGAIFPGKVHAPVPDKEEMGSHLLPVSEGRFVGNPRFRGEFIHPQFAGIRVEINDYGLRDDPGEASPPDSHEVSILVLGDSFAFGTGVTLAETFQEQLEKSAGQITEKPLRVYGAGVPGYGTYQEWQILRELIPKTRPDLVVVAVFEENDFLDNWGAEKRAKNKIVNGNDVAVSATQHSKLGSFILSVFSGPFWLRTSSLVQLGHARLKPFLFKLGLLKSVSFDFFRDQALLIEPPELVNHVRHLVIQKLLDIRRECMAVSSGLVVLVIPSVFQANPERFEAFLSLKAEEERSAFSRVKFHDIFITQLHSKEFVVVDMLPVLEVNAVSGNLCYHQEGHWNAKGHALASSKLIPVLRDILDQSTEVLK